MVVSPPVHSAPEGNGGEEPIRIQSRPFCVWGLFSFDTGGVPLPSEPHVHPANVATLS